MKIYLKYLFKIYRYRLNNFIKILFSYSSNVTMLNSIKMEEY